MKINRNSRVLRLIILFGVVGMTIIVVSHFYECDHRIRSNELPFKSMKLPIRDVDASVLMTFGDIRKARRAILVKITDDAGTDSYFAILNDGKNGKFETILKNLDGEWDRDNGFNLLRGSMENEPIPDVFFDQRHRFESVKNSRLALKDLVRIMRRFSPGNSFRIRIALENIMRKD